MIRREGMGGGIGEGVKGVAEEVVENEGERKE